MIAPLTLDRFFRTYYERKPLLVRQDQRATKGVLDRAPFTVDDLESVVWQNQDRLGDFALLCKEDSSEHPVDSATRRDRFVWLRRQVADGHSVVLNYLENYHVGVAGLVREFEQAFAAEAAASAFLTPARGICFSAHFDHLDVVFLQCVGSKRWRIYPPVVELPTASQARPLSPDELGEPCLDTVLKEGDLLYLPRGFIHQGTATAEHSLHLSVGITPYSLANLLRDGLQALADSEPALRRTAISAEDAADAKAIVIDYVRRELTRAAEAKGPNRALGADCERFLAARPAAPIGSIDGLLTADRVRRNTPVVRASGIALHWEQDPDADNGILVYLAPPSLPREGAAAPPALRLPGFVVETLEFVNRTDGPFRALELPDSLTAKAKTELVRRLLERGALTRAFRPNRMRQR